MLTNKTPKKGAQDKQMAPLGVTVDGVHRTAAMISLRAEPAQGGRARCIMGGGRALMTGLARASHFSELLGAGNKVFLLFKPVCSGILCSRSPQRSN